MARIDIVKDSLSGKDNLAKTAPQSQGKNGEKNLKKSAEFEKITSQPANTGTDAHSLEKNIFFLKKMF